MKATCCWIPLGKLAWWRCGLALLLFLFLLPGTVAAVVTLQATPPTANITPDLNNAIHISYTALDVSAAAVGPVTTFSAVSTQGLLRTEDGTVLATITTSVIVNGVNRRGIAAETLIVPARVVIAALNAGKSFINYQRTFDIMSVDSLTQATVETSLWITPASAGQFSLVRMGLEFNQPPSSDLSRPSSGGRVTVTRNTGGLGAVAKLAYRGSGTLRGQWKVDNQILSFATVRLNAGQGEVSIASPVAPAFPTYAGGLHKVEFEVLDPAPGFTAPAIYYFVTEEERLPAAGSLQLDLPLERDRLEFGPEVLPQFTWQGTTDGVLYLFRLWSLDASANIADLSTTNFSVEKAVTAAVTRQPFFALTPFDLAEIHPGRPYVWQVRAYRGTELIAVSRDRVVYFVQGKAAAGVQR